MEKKEMCDCVCVCLERERETALGKNNLFRDTNFIPQGNIDTLINEVKREQVFFTSL